MVDPVADAGDRDVPGGFPEIALRSRLDAIGAGTEINPVEVEFENLLFRIGGLYAQAEQDLTDLTIERSV